MLTVALPLFNAKNIAWLPLESFARQRGINFDWELVIAEEQNENMFGKDNVMEFQQRLSHNGCKEIKYIPLKEWIPLSRKWRLIAKESDDRSEVFFCQAADNYSHPMRMKEAYDYIKGEGYDYIWEPRTVLYCIPTNEAFIIGFYGAHLENKPHKGLHFSFKTKYAKNLPDSKKKRVIDKWLYENVIEQSGKNYRWKSIDSKSWKEGFNTHGFHTLSMKRFDKKCVDKNKVDLQNYINYWPSDIVKKLQSLQQLSYK